MATKSVKRTRRSVVSANGKQPDPLLEYRALLDEIDFSERGTPEELAARDLDALKATAKMRRKANTIALGLEK